MLNKRLPWEWVEECGTSVHGEEWINLITVLTFLDASWEKSSHPSSPTANVHLHKRTRKNTYTLPHFTRERERRKKIRDQCVSQLLLLTLQWRVICAQLQWEKQGAAAAATFFPLPSTSRDPARFEIQSLCLRLNSIYVHRFPLLTSLFKRVVCHVILPPIFMLLWDAARLGVWWAESLPSARHSQCGWWLKCVNWIIYFIS